ncbi:MAG: hypothetical protein FWF87_05040 [Synergistaceae bacterium]|nr:hypothetical protein [Synergistaceae bacterium]
MGEYRIIISDLAKQDIRETAEYIRNELQEPIIAERTTEAILEAIFTIEDKIPNKLPIKSNFANRN